ncbi:PKD domain-containing protein, partial [Lentimicrobium sp. S6]|uniref:PKD domain-containing protein n=1 Tax=Lentimicrobium sp. S6 TaxID=2735872 RepID=UPI001553BA1C
MNNKLTASKTSITKINNLIFVLSTFFLDRLKTLFSSLFTTCAKLLPTHYFYTERSRSALLTVSCSLLTIILTLSPLNSTAQKEAHNWYFGNNAGITFNTVPPSLLPSSNMSIEHGSTTFSDKQGNLLFYTNGDFIRNMHRTPMENYTTSHYFSGAITNSLSIPFHNDSTKYHLFNVSTGNSKSNKTNFGLFHSIIEPYYNNGIGRVTIRDDFIFGTTYEKMAITKHANGKDWWLLIHEFASNKFLSFLIDENGLNSTPVISEIGYTIPNIERVTKGYLRFSPNGKYCAIAYPFESDIMELLKFNNETGKLSDVLTFTNFQDPFGLEFSPDNSKLYVTSVLQEEQTPPDTIFQLDISSYNLQDISNSKTMIHTSGDEIYDRLGGLQMGPDQKLYFAIFYGDYIGVINQPNLTGLACDVNHNGVYLGGGSNKCDKGLPFFPQNYLNPADFSFISNCAGNPIPFTLTNSDNITSVSWDFGDGETSTETNPIHTYNNPGTYQVLLEVVFNGTIYNDSRNIEITGGPIFTITPSSLECEGEDMQLSAPTGYSSYEWSNGGTTASTTVNSSGTYTCIINDNGGCLSSESYDLVMNQPDNVSFTNPNAVCSGETAVELNGGLPTGGVYSGSHVSAGYFNAQAAGIG